MKNNSYLSQEFLSSVGVLDWGYTEVSTPVSWDNYERWIKQGKHGSLSYLADYRQDLRKDIRNVSPNFQSALVFLFPYHETKKWMLENNRHEVAAYAFGFEGEDYHHVLAKKLALVKDELVKQIPNLSADMSLDIHPVLERDLAFRSGLGWFGKNSMLINQKHGSYFIIASLLLNQGLPLQQSSLDTDHCGQCLACVEACPTQAIDPISRTLNASQCISTYTIEVFKETAPPKGFDRSRGEVFGCDICQDVCPWNKKSLSKISGKFQLKDHLLFLKEWFYIFTKSDFLKMLEKESGRSLKKKLLPTVFGRPGKAGWMKNLKYSKKN